MIVLISPEVITSSLTELLETNYGCPKINSANIWKIFDMFYKNI